MTLAVKLVHLYVTGYAHFAQVRYWYTGLDRALSYRFQHSFFNQHACIFNPRTAS